MCIRDRVIAAKKDAETGAMVDRYLSDGEWRDIAATYLDRIGLAPRGDDLGVRWVAVRHADDHVHVVANPGPPGRPAGVPPQRLLPGRRCLPRGRGQLR